MPFDYEGIIPAHSAKRINKAVASSVDSLMEAVDVYYWWDKRARSWEETTDTIVIPEEAWKKQGWMRKEHREGKVEFRILDFTVE